MTSKLKNLKDRIVFAIKKSWRKVVAVVAIPAALAGGFVGLDSVDKTPLVIPTVKQIDSKDVAFSFADDNTNEDIIIKTENGNYNILTKDKIKISLTNTNAVGQNVKVRGYFSDAGIKITSLTEITNTKVSVENERVALKKEVEYTRPQKAKVVAPYSSDTFSLFVGAGETKYLEAEIDVSEVANKSSFKAPAKFFVEAVGELGAYGHLDPDVTYVQFKSGTCGGSCTGSTQASASFSATSGNLIVALVAAYNGGSATSVTGVTDTAGNTYVQGTSCAITSNGLGVNDIWYAKNITGHASNVVTVTFAHSGSTYRSIYAHEYAGADTSAPFELCTTKVATSATSATTDSFSPAASGNVNVALMTGSGSAVWEPGTNYTEIVETDSPDRASMHRLSAPSGAQTATANSALTTTIGISLASFKPAGSGGGSNPTGIGSFRGKAHIQGKAYFK